MPMWNCPVCGRSFRNANQQHSCRLIRKEELFAKRPVQLKKIYDKILSAIKFLGEYREETVPPDVIFFKTVSTFLALKVKRNCMEVEFFLDHPQVSDRVSKRLQISAKRVVHVVPVDSLAGIDKQLINWITQSYQLILSAKNNNKNNQPA